MCLSWVAMQSIGQAGVHAICHPWDLNDKPDMELAPPAFFRETSRWSEEGDACVWSDEDDACASSSQGMLGEPFWETNYSEGSSDFDKGDSADTDDSSSDSGIDAFAYTSKTFFSFDRPTYNLMLGCIGDGLVVTIDVLKTHDRRGILDVKRWARIKDSLHIVVTQWGSKCLALSTGELLACVEDWEDIVVSAHSSAHLALQATVTAVASTWCTNIRKHGISVKYVKAVLGNCGCAAKLGLCRGFTAGK